MRQILLSFLFLNFTTTDFLAMVPSGSISRNIMCCIPRHNFKGNFTILCKVRSFFFVKFDLFLVFLILICLLH